jgi:hypothetical protein
LLAGDIISGLLVLNLVHYAPVHHVPTGILDNAFVVSDEIAAQLPNLVTNEPDGDVLTSVLFSYKGKTSTTKDDGANNSVNDAWL